MQSHGPQFKWMTSQVIEKKSSMKNIPEFSWIGCMHKGIPVATENLDACIKFYTEVLGLNILSRPKTLDEFRPGAWLGDKDDAVQFHLIANNECSIPGEEAQINPMSRHTAWKIKDVDAFRDRLSSLKIEFKEITGLLGTPQIFALDPQGFTWGFQSSSYRGSF